MNIKPTGFNVVVQPDPIEEKTAGGLLLPGDSIDAETRTQTMGSLVAVSPMAFRWPDWPEGSPLPQVGDRVMYQRYSGASSKVGDQDQIVIKDEDIIAVIEE